MEIPSSVRHTEIQLSRISGVSIEPQWNDEDETWSFHMQDEIECSPEVLLVLGRKTCNQEEHIARLKITFARVRRNHGMKSWKMVKCTIQLDDLDPEEVPFGVIASLLSRPTNPDGKGKISSGEHQSIENSALGVQKKTVVRI
jgi:hypothetical protein